MGWKREMTRGDFGLAAAEATPAAGDHDSAVLAQHLKAVLVPYPVSQNNEML